MEEDLSPWQKLGSLIFRERCSASQVILSPFVKPCHLQASVVPGRVQSKLPCVRVFAFIINNGYVGVSSYCVANTEPRRLYALFYLILKKKKISELEIISPKSQKWENWGLGEPRY